MSIVHIPFYPSDWLAGTRGMSDTETGVYITLICRMYEMAAPIERNDDRLYRLCGSRSKASFQKALNFLIDEGKITEGEDGLFNDRVQKEIEKVTEKSLAAKGAAKARWDKKSNKINGGKNADASNSHMQTQCQPKPEPIKKEPKGSSKGSNSKAQVEAEILAELSRVCSEAVAKDFIEHRKEIKSPLTVRAAKGLANKVQGHPNPDAVFNESITNSWKGVFPDKVHSKSQVGFVNGNASPGGEGYQPGSLAAKYARFRKSDSEDPQPRLM